MKKTKVMSLTINMEILKILDEKRGMVSRSAFVQDLVKKRFRINKGLKNGSQ